MKFNVADVVLAGDKEYLVIGSVTYRNMNDGNCWDEYRLSGTKGGPDAWLSVDDVFREYSVSWVRSSKPSFKGYHLVDQGQETAVSVDGLIDVSVGDSARFSEFEDESEEKIISEELWSDGPEYSTGYYLDQSQIVFVRHDEAAYNAVIKRGRKVLAALVILFCIIPILTMLLAFLLDSSDVSDDGNDTSIRQHSVWTRRSDGSGLSNGK